MRIINPKKSLGQNFLIDENTINKIVNLVDFSKNDEILEVGPGTGNLTEKILEKNPNKFLLVEKDNNLYDELINRFGDKVEVFNEDILNFKEDKHLNQNIIVFGNLPYNISSQILVKWIKLKNINKKFKKFILMFQKEVADRIVAKENNKNYSRLSVISSWKFNAYKIFEISPESFKPRPKVKSAVIVLEPKKSYENLKNPNNLEHVTNVFFNLRRKKIKKPFKILFENYEEIAERLDIDLNLRPQNIEPKKFLEICKEYEKLIN